jgi:hypothetical protein
MKRGLWIVALLLCSFSAYAFLCPSNLGTGPSSAEGRGAVQICNVIYYCGNNTDGVCPEDFVNATGQRANCTNCPDADCLGNVYGYVFDNTTAQKIEGANVSLYNSFMIASNLTGPTGFYNLTIPSGYQVIAASKLGYDTVVENVLVPRSSSVRQDFSLPLGICHADCTNEFGRCNPACNGMNFSVNGSGALETCSFQNSEILNACANKKAGALVYLRPDVGNTNYAFYANCCEGSEQRLYRPEPSFTCENGKGFVKVQRIVTFNGRPVKLTVAVCE